MNKPRDQIAGKLADDEPVVPWLTDVVQPQYAIPQLPASSGELPQVPQMGSSFSMEGYTEGGSVDPRWRLGQPDYGMRLRYGRQF